MEAVIYCICECMEDNLPTVGNGERPKADVLYEKGYKKVIAKTKLAKDIYDSFIEDFNDYGCRNYKDTIVKGIPVFFMKYDPMFAPQDHLLTLDYPLMEDDRKESIGLCGVDLILFYLQCIRKEQRFLSRFEPEAIKEMLRRIRPEYESLYLDNICDPIFESL